MKRFMIVVLCCYFVVLSSAVAGAENCYKGVIIIGNGYEQKNIEIVGCDQIDTPEGQTNESCLLSDPDGDGKFEPVDPSIFEKEGVRVYIQITPGQDPYFAREYLTPSGIKMEKYILQRLSQTPLKDEINKGVSVSLASQDLIEEDFGKIIHGVPWCLK